VSLPRSTNASIVAKQRRGAKSGLDRHSEIMGLHLLT